MAKLVVAVLNGWGSSSRRRESRTAALVRRTISNMGVEPEAIVTGRALLAWSRSRRYKRFIRHHQSYDRVLLCVGKSLGARNMVSRILNPLGDTGYKKTALLTIDPCWPIRWDLRPNLNHHTLHLSAYVDLAINVLCVLPPAQQAGAILTGQNVSNVPVTDHDHFSIVQSPDTKDALSSLLAYLLA